MHALYSDTEIKILFVGMKSLKIMKAKSGSKLLVHIFYVPLSLQSRYLVFLILDNNMNSCTWSKLQLVF